jgi:hypothetical protein
MEEDVRFDYSEINWGIISQILKQVGMALFKTPHIMTEKGFTE